MRATGPIYERLSWGSGFNRLISTQIGRAAPLGRVSHLGSPLVQERRKARQKSLTNITRKIGHELREWLRLRDVGRGNRGVGLRWIFRRAF
jgi:hypothetical protein